MGLGGVGGMHSHYIVKPNLVLRLGWGFDNNYFVLKYIWKSLYLGQEWADHAVTNFVGTWL